MQNSRGTAERSLHTIGSYRIHALHSGAGEPLLLLHGLSGSARWWRHNVPAFARHYRTHAPDLIGFGRSRAWVAQPTIREMTDVLLSWLDRQEIERAHVIGHSMGGQVAIHMAARAPARVNRLVLVSSAGIPRHLDARHLLRFVSEVVPPRAWGSPAFLPTIAGDALRAGPRVLLRATYQLLHDDVRPLLPRIAAPTLIVWGGLDALTPLAHGEFMAQHIARSELIVFEHAAHMPMVDDPARFNQAVLEFFRRS